MGIPLHLLQQPECLSHLSLQSLVKLQRIILYLVLLQFFSICTCASNCAFVVEPIFVINMVGYEISDCLLSNSKHVIFKLGITLHMVCKSKTSVIDVEIRNISRIHYVCDQSPLHTRHPLENCLRQATLRKRLPHKTVCDGQPLPHSFFYAPCVMHSITQAIKLLISCAMATLSQTI